MTRPEPGNPTGPSRRELLGLGIGAFVVMALPFTRRRPAPVRRVVPAMGTTVELAVVHGDVGWAHAAAGAAAAAILEVERTMTRFRPDSDVGRANRAAGRAAVTVSPATLAVLEEALRWAEWSDGAFDPCLGLAVGLWDVGRRSSPPPPAEVQPLVGRRLYRALDVGRAGSGGMVHLRDPDAALDLGGIAKGYGVDAAVATLRDWGVRHALVGAGGDIYALGRAPSGDPWRIGVRSPEDPGRLLETLELEDAAVATSGDYEQYFRHRGERYHHLLDPATASPVRGPNRSVTVVADTCMRADAAATAVFGSPPDGAARRLALRAPDVRIARSA